MSIRYLAAGLALAAFLSACGQKQASTEPAPSAPTSNAKVTAAPASMPAPNAPAAQTPATAAAATQFDSKSGSVEFTLAGMQTGTETMTWDDYGARTVTETKTTTSFGGMPPRSHEMRVIRTGDSIIMVNFETKTAMKMDHIIEQAKAFTGSQDMRVFSQEMMAQMGASKTGTDTVVGKSCDVWTMTQMGMTVCTWKGLALKTNGNMMGVKISKLATKIDENVPVDPALFEVPAGFTTTNAPTLNGNGMPAGMPGAMTGAVGSPPPSGGN